MSREEGGGEPNFLSLCSYTYVENYAAYVPSTVTKGFSRLSCLPLIFLQNSDFPAKAEGGNRFLPRPMFAVYWASRFQEEERAFPPSQTSTPLFLVEQSLNRDRRAEKKETKTAKREAAENEVKGKRFRVEVGGGSFSLSLSSAKKKVCVTPPPSPDATHTTSTRTKKTFTSFRAFPLSFFFCRGGPLFERANGRCSQKEGRGRQSGCQVKKDKKN